MGRGDSPHTFFAKRIRDMKIVTPEIFHLAGTRINQGGLQKFKEFHSIPDWKTDYGTEAELLIEVAGRRCYQSWETDTKSVSKMNQNLSKVRVGNRRYIGNLLKVGHGSVLEHAVDTYALENVSRVVTHEIVRHRLCAFSQESLRFVRPTSLRAYFPEVFQDLPEPARKQVSALFEGCFEELEIIQKHLVEVLGMDQVTRAFGDKKKLQSAMRRLMPIGMATGIIITTNHRNWRHLIAMRTAQGAEEEIRLVFSLIADDLAVSYPALYQDMRISKDGEYSFEYGRV